MSGVKYSSKTSSGDLGIGTVGPTEDVKGFILGVTKLVATLEAMLIVDGAGGNVCVEEIVDGEAEAVAMGEWDARLWIRFVVDQVRDLVQSGVCVVGGSVVSAGAIAEMGWAKASFNCTGVWDKD